MALLGWGCIICILAAAGTIAEAVQVMVGSPVVHGILGQSVLLSISTPLKSMKWSVKKEDSQTVRILKAENKTQPEITPTFLQRVELLKNGSILLRNLTFSDQGVYTVTVTDWDGREETGTITLTVSAPLSEPLISVSVRNTSHSMLLTLSCKVTEGTQPSYWWLKDGKPLPRDGRHFVSEQNSSLEVRNVTEQDCVTYTCVSWNRLGSREAQRSVTANDTTVCLPAWALTQSQALSIAAAVLCVAGLCVILYCTKKHYQEIWQWIRGVQEERGLEEINRRGIGIRRDYQLDTLEENLYNEVADAQDGVVVSVGAVLPYSYMDFLPAGICRGGTAEERVYSTIEDTAAQAEGSHTHTHTRSNHIVTVEAVH
ncbi:junctional adhesion molecule C-like [Acipenser oxyrinchus oxyrinchus]|uniref:Junctional adhesion molecule C-like n=1 Tax=Acipenser oxyrinchus oxyrinchus TaxID=40147 RepID=A0AAD8FSS1_ACIOX|nr:junctional adhesion molecule C-like [Acipenser oxyrinchus oxyrinchus]